MQEAVSLGLQYSPSPWSAIASQALPAVAGVVSGLGAWRANYENRKLAREQMAFQTTSAREAMAFSERMAGSTYQRAVADMKMAGINPMLAFAQGGAPSPSGVSAGGSTAHMENIGGAAVSTAVQARRLMSELKQMDASTALTESQRRASDATAERTRKETELLNYEIPGARQSAKIDSGRFGAAAAWAKRIFGGGLLRPR